MTTASRTPLARAPQSGFDGSLVEPPERPSAGGGARDALRFHLLMGLGGFLGGLAIVVPVVLWLSAGPGLQHQQQVAEPKSFLQASAVDVGSPALVSVPTLAERAAPVAVAAEPDDKKPAQPVQPDSEAVAKARQLIRSGDIAGARGLLSAPEFAQHGEAVFMLAETYDPNVLAALGARGVVAETHTARRLYDAARALGMTAAERRLEQLR